MASFYKLPFDFRSCSLRGCIDPWEPPGLPLVILSFLLNPETGHRFPQQLLHNPKGTWVTSPAPDFVHCASHMGFLGKKDVTRKGGDAYLRWELFFHRENKPIRMFFRAMMKLRRRGLSE